MRIDLLCRIGFLVALLLIIGGSLAPEAWLTYDLADYDKLLHLAGYFALAMMAALGWPRWRGAALVGLPLVGLALEVAQTSIGRNFDWKDALTNAAGIGVAVAASAALTRWLAQERKSR